MVPTRTLSAWTVPDVDGMRTMTEVCSASVRSATTSWSWWPAIVPREINGVLAALATGLTLHDGILALSSALTVRFIVRKGLRPVDQLAHGTTRRNSAPKPSTTVSPPSRCLKNCSPSPGSSTTFSLASTWPFAANGD